MKEKKKKTPVRIPVPQKPPKILEDKSVYNRNEEKRKLKKEILRGK